MICLRKQVSWPASWDTWQERWDYEFREELHSTDGELSQENDVRKTKAQNKPKASVIQPQSQEDRLGKKNQIYSRRRPSKSNFHLRY